MSKVKILDCTLRDGGYINDFYFGETKIKKIIAQLTEAGIDIIECGFLRHCDYNPSRTLFNSVEQISKFIPSNRRNSLYVGMIQYGKMPIEEVCKHEDCYIDGIRLSFHYNEVDEALEYGETLKAKGYKVFVQPVGTSSYSDEQLLYLINKVNLLEPYSFYLVDTLGLMDKDDVLRFFYLINHNLKKTIRMGFHSHNNLQLSFSNCQALASLDTDREISFDSSVYGMGRGAGNLNTELIATYLNRHLSHKYEIDTLLEIIDESIVPIKKEHEWGYAVPYYLAAINGCHPNYASYLIDKQTLNVKNISTILRSLEQDARSLFDKKKAEMKYLEFQAHEIDDITTMNYLESILKGKNIIVLAPGSSLNEKKSEVIQCAVDNECKVISTNFVPDFIDCDFTFLTNLKRYKSTFNPYGKGLNLICTSNIQIDDKNVLFVNYSTLLNEDDVIKDNTAMLLLNLLVKIKVKKVFLAGLDGFDLSSKNYYQERLIYNKSQENMQEINNSISRHLHSLSDKIELEFVTPSHYKL